MTTKQTLQFNKMLTVLKKISKAYQTPSQLKRNSGKQYGLDYEEALEMSYENIQGEAALACKGVKAMQVES